MGFSSHGFGFLPKDVQLAVTAQVSAAMIGGTRPKTGHLPQAGRLPKTGPLIEWQ
jgi:hypothetical protein